MSHLARGIWTLLLCIAVGGCVSGKSLGDRHSMSRLVNDPGSDTITFEATVSPDYPATSDAAEREREDWMRQWLDRARLCANGFTVVDRVSIGSAADNPYRHDLRYTLRCTP